MIGNILDGLSTRLPIPLTGARFGVQVFTSSGTFQRPTGALSVTALAIIVGGGGGGGGGGKGDGSGVTTGSDGNAGGSSVFDTTSASGGAAGKGGASAAGANASSSGYQEGGQGQIANMFDGTSYYGSAPGGEGGKGFWGFGYGGRGGSGTVNNTNSNTPFSGNGGNSGAVNVFFGPVFSNVAVTVGARGTGGSAIANATGGQPGSAGAVIVFYWW